MEILVFYLAIISFRLCLPVYHNLMRPSRKNEFHNESPSNTVCIFLSVFNADICCWCNLCHLGLQNCATGVDICDHKKLYFDSSRS